MAGFVNNLKRSLASVESSSSTTPIAKRHRIHLPQLQLPSALSLDGLERHRFVSPDHEEVSPASSSSSTNFSGNFDSPSSCCCSSNESTVAFKEGLSLVDPEVKSFETETSSTCNYNKFSDMDSKAQRRRSTPAANTPTQEEIEQFFAAAEKKEQKMFSEKYNYDVEKDAPLEGRYEWVRLKP